MIIDGVLVKGIDVDEASRCKHYHSERDIVAIQFYCCKDWYACIDCHNALADHPVTVWPVRLQNARAILCGKCGTKMSIRSYLVCSDQCPSCGADFNPGCRLHHHLYFETAS